MAHEQTDKAGQRSGTGWINVTKSTLAAACGIQTKANRDRDFQQGKPSTFIVAGIVFVIVFIFAMYGIVQLVLSLAA